jgi:hypothetical protein
VCPCVNVCVSVCECVCVPPWDTQQSDLVKISSDNFYQVDLDCCKIDCKKNRDLKVCLVSV